MRTLRPACLCAAPCRALPACPPARPPACLPTWLSTLLPACVGILLPAVVVDCDTIFTALIMSQHSLPAVEPFPRPVMQVGGWSGGGVWRGELGERVLPPPCSSLCLDRSLVTTEAASVCVCHVRCVPAAPEKPARQHAHAHCGTATLYCHSALLQYTERLYGTVFDPHGAFWLRENGEAGAPPAARPPAPAWLPRLQPAPSRRRAHSLVSLLVGWTPGWHQCAASMPAACLPAAACRLLFWRPQVWRQCSGHHQEQVWGEVQLPAASCTCHSTPAWHVQALRLNSPVPGRC